MPIAESVAATSFHGDAGGTEHYVTVQAPADLSLSRQIDHVEQCYADVRAALGIAAETAVFRRLYLSDAPNQVEAVEQSRLFHDPDAGPVAMSIVQQPPLPGAKLALLAYHVEDDAPLDKTALSPQHTLVRKRGTRHLWSTRLCTGQTGQPTPANAQTREIFANLIGALAGHDGALADNCVRTWIYVKDVDVFYQDMVAARTALFQQHGLRRDTHYLASTGIEGACAHRYDTVLMDAYSNLDLRPGQVSYLNDFECLCATKDYNVTFERGTRVSYADRAHHFISGTASIDKAGTVQHRGDVLRQLDHALANVEALLRSGEADLRNMTHLLVYLRDAADYPVVEACLRERFPGLPILILRGAVCRPDWLIEVEGIGITAEHAPDLPQF